MVFYQTNNEKAQLGPAKVFDIDKSWVFIAGNRDIMKEQKYYVKLNMKANIESSDLEEDKEDSNENEKKNEEKKDKSEIIRFVIQ